MFRVVFRNYKIESLSYVITELRPLRKSGQTDTQTDGHPDTHTGT